MRSLLLLGLAVAALLVVALAARSTTAPNPAGLPAARTPEPPGRQARGPHSLNQLLAGLLLLEESPVPLTPAQAARVGQAMDGGAPEFQRAAFLTAQAAEVLRDEQVAALAGSRPGRFEPAPRRERAALVDGLERLAGDDPAERPQVPTDLPEGPSKKGMPPQVLDLLALEYDEFQRDGRLALSRDQAGRLVPLAREYASLHLTIEEVLAEILSTEQEGYIADNLGRLRPEETQMTLLDRQLRPLIAARAKGARRESVSAPDAGR